MENPENPEIFLKIKLDNNNSLKDLSEGERLFNERKVKESLDFFKEAEKGYSLFKSTYYTITGVVTFGLGLPIAKILMGSSVDPLYKGLAHSHFWNENYLQSIKYFNKISNKDFTDYYIEAWANYKVGNVERSKNLFKIAEKQKPELKAYCTPTM